MTRIVITDCDHDSIEIERGVAAERGVEVTLAQAATEDAVVEAAADADGILVQYAPITRSVLQRLPRLRAVGRYGVGLDPVDVDAATELGVAVTYVPDYGTDDVAVHAVALALALARGIVRFDRRLREGTGVAARQVPLYRLSEQTFGLVGLGRIGRASARDAAGLGFRVIGTDPMVAAGTTTAEGIEVVGFEDALERSDILSLHVPSSPGTRHLIAAPELARMKSSAYLVNTCRGDVVDTDALMAALHDGTIAGAGLDVFEQEPLPAGHPLLGLENTVLTPHVAWYSESSYRELKRRAIEGVIDAVSGVMPRNLANPESLGKKGRTP